MLKNKAIGKSGDLHSIARNKSRKSNPNSLSKEKKEKKRSIDENRSSRESQKRKKPRGKEKETQRGSICEKKGICEQDKDTDQYYCFQKSNFKTKLNRHNHSENDDRDIYLNSSQASPPWNFVSYHHKKSSAHQSNQRTTSQEKLTVLSNCGSLGFFHGVRESRAETNQCNSYLSGKQKGASLKSKKVHSKKKIKILNECRNSSKSSRFHQSPTSIEFSRSKVKQQKTQRCKKVSKEKKSKKKKSLYEHKIKKLGNQLAGKASNTNQQFLKLSDINFKQLHEQINEEEDLSNEILISSEISKERARSINMLGKICSSMNLKRETYSIAITYVDRFLDKNTDSKKVKTITIAALMMALKIDHAEAVGSLVCQFSNGNSSHSLASKGQSISTETKSFVKSIKKQKQHREDIAEAPQMKFNLNRPKLPNMFTTVLSCEEIFSEYDHILCKEEIADMEMQMMVKFNFKLSIKSIVHWIDGLTLIWDSYIHEKYPTLKSKLLYRSQTNIINFSYLNQLVECAFYVVGSYSFSRVLIILSFMYIITRICLEFGQYREEKGFEAYRVNLGKTSNTIFVDKMGINQLFGEYLQILKLEMGDIVSCCQYVSKFLNYKIFKIYTVDKKNPSQSYLDPLVNTYQYNPEIYRFILTKIFD